MALSTVSTETKPASALGKLGGKLASPVTLLLLAVAFLLGNVTRPLNFKGCNFQTLDSLSVHGVVISDTGVIKGTNVDSLRLDSLRKAHGQ